MPKRWICANGHGGNDLPSLPACPLCGASLSVPGTGQVDETLLPPSRVFDQRSVLLPTADPAVNEPVAPTRVVALAPSPDETLQRDSEPLLPASLRTAGGNRSAGVAPTSPLDGRNTAPPIPGDTLVKPSTPATRTMAAPIPTAVSGYEILGILGRGGMGVVYKARQVGLNRVVALKMILSGSHASDEEVMRFRIEAEAVAALQHPHIVQVHDFGQREGRPYFSLEYLEGGSLQQRLTGRPHDPREAARLIATLAGALDFAHRHGIVHRDVKPANILFDSAGQPRITDFGLAKRLVDEDQGRTGAEAILGTPTYMAPEQAQGRTRQVGPAADVYSLGAVLYDLLTGRPPFKGDTVLDTLQLVQTAEPTPPTRLQKKLPRDLETICLKCLQKDSRKRYDSAAALANDLVAFLEGRPIEARPIAAWERAWKWTRRRPAAAALLALAVGATGVVVAGEMISSARIRGLNATLEEKVEALDGSNAKLTRSEQSLRRKNDELLAAAEKLKVAHAHALRATRRAEGSERDAQESFLRAQQGVERVLNLAQNRLRNEPGTERIRKALREEAVQMCLHFTVRPGTSPPARLRAARAHRLLGELEEKLGHAKEAIHDYGESLKLYRALTDEIPRDESGPIDYESESLQAAMSRWGVLESVDPDRAERELEGILKRFDRLPAGAARSGLHRRNRAMLLANRALHAQKRGRFALADADYRAAIDLLGREKETPAGRLELARVEVNRVVLLAGGDPLRPGKRAELLAQARRDCERAVLQLDGLCKERPDDVACAGELGRAHANLGLILLAQHDGKAERVYHEAVRIFAALARDRPLVVDYRHLLAVALGNRGAYLLRVGKPVAAGEPLSEGRKLLEALAAGFTDVAGYRDDLARVCTTQGLALLAATRPAQAREPLEKALRLSEEAARARPGAEREAGLAAARRNLIACLDRLARAAGERRDWHAAGPHVVRLVELRQALYESLPLLGGNPSRGARAWRTVERIVVRAELIGTLRALCRVQEERRDHRGAVRSVADLEPLASVSWTGLIDSAALLARCVKLAQADRSLTASERSRLAREYGYRVLALLRKLAPHHPGLPARLWSKDFDAVRSLPELREGFRALQTEHRTEVR
jgi:serine/threonine-protein kinase